MIRSRRSLQISSRSYLVINDRSHLLSARLSPMRGRNLSNNRLRRLPKSLRSDAALRGFLASWVGHREERLLGRKLGIQKLIFATNWTVRKAAGQLPRAVAPQLPDWMRSPSLRSPHFVKALSPLSRGLAWHREAHRSCRSRSCAPAESLVPHPDGAVQGLPSAPLNVSLAYAGRPQN